MTKTSEIPHESSKATNAARPKKPDNLERITSYVEITSKIFGLITWPVIVIVVLFMFYVPIRKMVDMLPDKFAKSSEISVVGVMSLKIQEEAKAVGNEELAAIISGLSEDAIKWLIQLGDGSHRVIGSDDGRTGTVQNYTFPSYYSVWKELESKGLLQGTENLSDFEAFFQSLSPTPGPGPNMYQVPEGSLSDEQRARLLGNSVELTDSGKKAYHIIIKVIADLVTQK